MLNLKLNTEIGNPLSKKILWLNLLSYNSRMIFETYGELEIRQRKIQPSKKALHWVHLVLAWVIFISKDFREFVNNINISTGHSSFHFSLSKENKTRKDNRFWKYNSSLIKDDILLQSEAFDKYFSFQGEGPTDPNFWQIK